MPKRPLDEAIECGLDMAYEYVNLTAEVAAQLRIANQINAIRVLLDGGFYDPDSETELAKAEIEFLTSLFPASIDP